MYAQYLRFLPVAGFRFTFYVLRFIPIERRVCGRGQNKKADQGHVAHPRPVATVKTGSVRVRLWAFVNNTVPYLLSHHIHYL